MHNQAFEIVKQSMERKTLHIHDDWGHTRKGKQWIAEQTAINCMKILDELEAAGIAVNREPSKGK